MNLQELLDELRNNILRDKSDAVGPANDKLWTDETLVRYINEGYRRFARRTLCIRDSSTAAMTELLLEAGVDRYSVHKEVITVLTARIDGKDYDLHKTTHDSLAGAVSNTDRATASGVAPAPAEPHWFNMDEENHTLRVFPNVGADFDGAILKLRVARMPLEQLTVDNLDAELEINEDYHLDILEWAAFRALRNHDTDVENIGKAKLHENRFNAAVEEAKKDTQRDTFAPIEFICNSRW